MSKIKLSRKGMIPLRKLKVLLNEDLIVLKGNESKEIDLPAGKYQFVMKMDWWKSVSQIDVGSGQTTIEIKHYLPDIYYIAGILVVAILSALSLLGIIKVLFLSIWILLFIFYQVYSYFTKGSKYFSIV